MPWRQTRNLLSSSSARAIGSGAQPRRTSSSSVATSACSSATISQTRSIDGVASQIRTSSVP